MFGEFFSYWDAGLIVGVVIVGAIGVVKKMRAGMTLKAAAKAEAENAVKNEVAELKSRVEALVSAIESIGGAKTVPNPPKVENDYKPLIHPGDISAP